MAAADRRTFYFVEMNLEKQHDLNNRMVPCPTCVWETPVVPGRDAELRRAPLQPELESTLRVHILQPLSKQLVTNHPPKAINCSDKHKQPAPTAQRGFVGGLYPPPLPKQSQTFTEGVPRVSPHSGARSSRREAPRGSIL